jgi:hypothetical protein
MITVAPHDLPLAPHPGEVTPTARELSLPGHHILSLSPATGSGVCRILLTLEFTSISIVRQSTIFFFLAR